MNHQDSGPRPDPALHPTWEPSKAPRGTAQLRPSSRDANAPPPRSLQSAGRDQSAAAARLPGIGVNVGERGDRWDHLRTLNCP